MVMVDEGACSNGERHDLGDGDSVRQAARELKLLARSVVDRLEPMVAQVAQTQQAGPYLRSGCAWCPVCALMALSRGENHELLGYVASHGASLLSFVRALLDSADEDESGDLLMTTFAEMAEYARGFASSMPEPDSANVSDRARHKGSCPDNGETDEGRKRSTGHRSGSPRPPRRGRFEHIPVLIGS
ncbi:hypothetical protein [Hoyosella subflava]|uniref:Uncharacterized protein n=1 Tax=Hoyosella subflava (strain DSM 45089 / JCM 17490 / NBRC 109087 / DQS3-9A1) TaxID=443218 RepID=F6EFD5_HOYSD|nr:hypothetical protein [Hoyosella subflava]AEF39748.1 hypothetical protein AS9A_1296 [Hoyosella subflava DQS3-9A1]